MILDKIFQSILNIYPTENIANNKFLRFLFKIFYLVFRKFTTGPFILRTKFFNIFAFTSKNESSSIYFRGFHDLKMVEFCQKIYKKDDFNLFFDVGANVGNNTLSFLNYYKNSQVYSFEPVPKYFKQLTKNVALNNSKNSKLYNLAISNNNNYKSFYVDNLNPGSSSLIKKGVSYHGKLKKIKKKLRKISIKTKKIDDFYKNIPSNIKSFLIKIDVEGNESNVLSGAFRVLSKYKPDLIIELEERNFQKNRHNLNLNLLNLKKLKYNLFDLDGKKLSFDTELLKINKFLSNKIHFHNDYFFSTKKVIKLI